MRKPNIRYSAKEGYHSDRSGPFEVFWVSEAELSDPENTLYTEAGWYWWACEPGCLPDSDPSGPFTSSSAAYNDARSY